MESRLRVSVGGGVGASESGPAKRTRAEKARCCSRRRRLSSRVLFAGRRIHFGGTDFGGRRITRKGACSSLGCRNSGGRAGRSSGGTGRSGLAGGPWEDLSRRMYVRISLTLKTLSSSGCLEQDTWSVCQRMLFSSRKVSGAMTMQFPSDFSRNRHPMMSVPVSDDGRCRVGPDDW